MLLDNYKKESPIVGVAGLGGGINSYIFLSSGGDFVISKSLRFNSADTPKLTRTPSSATNRKTWTLAFWIKRTTTGSREQIISAAGSTNTYVEFQSDKLMIEDYNPGVNSRLWTTRVFRDPSAWYHIVVAMDTTQGTSSDRLKLYVNGVQETVFDTATYPSQNYDTSFNNTGEHKIGQFPGNANFPLNAYLADFHLVDGQALTPTSFGETDDAGVWQPKKFSGAYGTNGFHLDFKDTASIGNDAAGSNNLTATNITTVVYGLATANQGMDVLTYTGNGGTQSITGLSFQPDFVWYKNRTSSGSHKLFDVIRGVTKVEYSNYTEGGTVATSLTAFTSNGFNVGSDAGSNTNSNNYVAWCWKAGGAASSNTDGTITSSISANTTYGFSICTYTGIFGNKTVGHGLGKVPSMMFLKCTSHSDGWSVYHASLGNTNYLRLDSTATAVSTSPVFNSTSPTSSVFTIGQTGLVNETGRTYVAYVWSEISGFSKFGTYSGGTNPKTITTGFKPKFLIFKRTDTANHWIMIDNVRGGIKKLAADTSNEENHNATIGDDSQNIVEFLDDGFKLTTTNAGTNVSGGTYVYAAWASKPDPSTLDVLIDSPSQSVADETDSGLGGQITGNYATLNPLNKGSNITLKEGNLGLTSSGHATTLSTITVTAGMKTYMETTVITDGINGWGITINPHAENTYSTVAGKWWAYDNGSNFSINTEGSNAAYGVRVVVGDVLQLAVDYDAGKAFIGINNTWINSTNGTNGNPSTGANPTFTFTTTDPIFLLTHLHSGELTVNYGQRAFVHTAPTNFKTHNAANLPVPTGPAAEPNKYFDTKLYSGNGGTQSITMDNSELSPDFVWIKCRNDAFEHQLFDSVRGALKSFRSDNDSAEATVANSLTSFDSNGFSLGSSQSVNHTKNFASWAWEAGTSTVTNNVGSVTSQVRASPSSGFSIVKYTYSSTGTVGHGLNAQPHVVIQRPINASGTWYVYTKALNYHSAVYLNLTNTAGGTTTMNNVDPTSTVFTTNNFNPGDNLAYCFAPVAGYSAMSSFVGNGNASNGPMITTGFKPRWLLVKNTSAARDWVLLDTARSDFNVANDALYPNLTSTEDTGTSWVDILSNGFKIRTDNASYNTDGNTYIYLAFAEEPFKSARAR